MSKAISASSARCDGSIVWKFYTIDSSDSSKAICKQCGVSVSRGGKSAKSFTTSNLKKHLQSKHNDDLLSQERERAQQLEHVELKRHAPMSSFVNFAKKQKSETSSGPSTSQQSTSEKQLTLGETYELKKLWDINSSKAKAVHYKIAEMIALDCQPFSIAEDLGFTRLMKHCAPNYEIPSRKFFSVNIIPSIYTSLVEKVTAVTDQAENISLTTDVWTNNSNYSFISLTGHCLDNNFEQTQVILRVKPFPGSHTAANIAEAIQDSIDDFKIPKYKIHVIVRDNGANVVRGVNESGYSSLSCFLHTIQLIIHDAIFEQGIIKNIITNCKRIVGHFSHSQLAYRRLEELQKQNDLPQHKLIQDVPTRWNSKYFMLERMFEQKFAVSSYCTETADLPVFDANKWSLIGKLCKLLKVFHTTTVR